MVPLSIASFLVIAVITVQQSLLSDAACGSFPLPQIRRNFQPYDQAWQNFTRTYRKQYANSSEEEYRRGVFVDNVKQIEEHNRQYLSNETSFWMAINEFADMTAVELISDDCIPELNRRRRSVSCEQHVPSTEQPMPCADWLAEGYVTAVKNQGRECGACWAFSTTGSVEGQHFKSTGSLVSLSEQQLVDCDTSNYGCKGGLMDKAFSHINTVGGIMSSADYPYREEKGSCRFDKHRVVTTVSGCKQISEGSETDLLHAVSTVGPVAAAIEILDSFRKYGGDVYIDDSCSGNKLDHAVLVVGYGTEDGTDYWLVKNSWGSEWGMMGYIRMARNRNNMCGIASYAMFPTTTTVSSSNGKNGNSTDGPASSVSDVHASAHAFILSISICFILNALK
ncbi:hypothetical protein BaRGS_00013553 [Batillaria attramentaria]|uniref:Uncharacterized protein n=1 Tax=Batillaria attramentaria TaxID=370345 RepID=A0ABD0L6P1_9CAEN